MPYTYDQTRATLLLDGVDQFSVLPDVDPEMHGVLATPLWIAKLNDGTAAVDVPNKRVQFQNYGGSQRTFTARTEDQRDEVLTLLTEFASQLETDVGLTQARSRALVKILWKFLKRALALMGR